MSSCDHGQARYKVEVNAQQNHLTGCALRCAGLCVVVVEGGQKALQRYKRLMLARIQWDAPSAEGEGAPGGAGAPTPNSCELVWEGPIPGPAFQEFRVVARNADFLAREYLEERGVAHYWDLATSFQSSAGA